MAQETQPSVDDRLDEVEPDLAQSSSLEHLDSKSASPSSTNATDTANSAALVPVSDDRPLPLQPEERIFRQRQDVVTAEPIDLRRGLAKRNSRQSCMALGATAKVFGNIAGFAGLGAGYALGKIDGAVWGSDMADSKSFLAACSGMLSANGISPTVVCDYGKGRVGPLPDDEETKRDILRSAPIIVVNHVSYIDVTILPVVLNMPKFVSKSEVKNWPVFGALGKDLDYVWVDRNSKDSRAATMEAIASHAENWKDGDRPLVLFPEGTTSSGQSMLEFRKGAFIPGRPVLPVVLKYTGAWDPSNPDFREAVSSDDEGAERIQVGDKKVVKNSDGDWAKQFAGHNRHTCLVYICERYDPSEEEIGDAQLYADNVRKSMLKTLKEMHSVFSKRGDSCENADTRIENWRRRNRMKKQVSNVADLSPGASPTLSPAPAEVGRARARRNQSNVRRHSFIKAELSDGE
eukprot:TRINITY_DN25315_c0_g1_i1.p1 TRINITY_DN25315_c0_g1~~TRINITY_DN25315_c0_g1_i1.p1  ORF type:complete len:461 (+),score=63.91 TRINITY_DN25315_c0_g1_i1:184-1566(+)